MPWFLMAGQLLRPMVGQLMIQGMLVFGQTHNVPGWVKHQAGHMVHPRTLIYQLHSKCKSSRLFNRCQYGLQVLFVGASVKVAQPARCFVSLDCCDRGFEIIAMGLLELYGLEVTGTGGSPING